MKYIASCSFGKDSIATIILAHEHNEPLDTIIYSRVMYDREKGWSGEDTNHENFIFNVAIPKFREWGYEVVVLESEHDYKYHFNHIKKRSKYPEHIGKKQGFPIAFACCIQSDLKLAPIRKYYKSLGCDYIEYVGIAIDEPKRLERLETKTNKVSLLAKYNVTEEMAVEMCKEYGLYSPMYEYTKRGGCWFCPNARPHQLRQVRDKDRAKWDDLVALGDDENLCVKNFNRTQTIGEIERRFKNEDRQLKLY